MITNRALPVLSNLCILTDKFNRQYDKEFGQKGKKIGATCNVRVPPRYLGTFGPALNVEPSTETYVPVPILYQFHVDIQFNTINMLLDIDEFEERFIHPACMAVANRVDNDGAYFAFQQTANRSGTPGTTPTSYKAFSDARATLVSEGMPKGMLPSAVLHPFAQSAMADSLKGLFNPQVRIDQIFETGMVAKKTAGADWFEDPNIAAYSTGSFLGATPVLAGVTTAVGGSAIITSGWNQTGILNLSGLTASSAACVVGDTIQIAGIFPVNPQSRGQYGNTFKTFVVLPPGGYAQMAGVATPGGPQFAPATLAAGTFNSTPGTATVGLYTASGTGTLSVTVGECVITGGQFQNCKATAAFTGTPAVTLNNGALLATNSTENLYFHRDAFALATVDLPLPRNATGSRAYDEDLGISIRIVEDYTINNDAEPTRLDIAYGFASLYRSLAQRISG
jgi:P22 coat protein - gene protein 5